jgi:PKD repeat protein
VKDNDNGLGNDTAKVVVNPLNNHHPPKADAGGPYSGVIGSPITFDGSGSNDADGTIVSYLWNFGDSTTGTGVSPIHTYTIAGNYTVILTVTDNEGITHSNSTTANISVIGRPTIVIYAPSNLEPIVEGNEQTIPITVHCYNQTVSNIHLEILETSNLTVTLLSPNITLNPGESKELLIKVKVPKLDKKNNSENKVFSETIVLRAVGDGNVTSDNATINIVVTPPIPGFETIATITAVGTAGALVAFFRRRNRNG